MLKTNCTFRVDCADIPHFIDSLNTYGVELENIRILSELSVEMTIEEKYTKQFAKIAEKLGADCRVVKNRGLGFRLKAIFKRPVLIITLLFLLFITLCLPQRVWFVRVEGNIAIPDRYILEKADTAGICFGASRREIRSEKVKNALLAEIPQLQWAGINTYGCTAVISVREKKQAEEVTLPEQTAIYAACDGIIQSCTVVSGRAVCEPGQAVKKGQLLISGLIDCGSYYQATEANGEIIAHTARELTAVTPVNAVERLKSTGKHICRGIRIGKKLIKFCNHSGIYSTTCVKMYEEKVWALPGGFSLPVAWVNVITENFDTQTASLEKISCQPWLQTVSEEYICSQMIAGQIEKKDTKILTCGSLFQLNCKFTCLEMIGRAVNKEIP